MFISKVLDMHSPTHFLGSFGLFMSIHHLDISYWESAVITLILGILWEILDEVNYRFCFEWKFFDLRGADLTDICTDALGIILGLVFVQATHYFGLGC